jgi:pyruvate formate lyase activating enzyme
MGIWVEVTTLIIPTENDSDKELRAIAEFIKSIDKGIPWHVSAFYPTYKMTNLPRTPVSTIRKAYELGKEAGLRYIYGGNVPGDESESTRCYCCGTMLIRRFGFQVIENRVRDSQCPECGAKIDGVF